ncbi:MAG: deoxyribodipyrimidine photo-lyase [Methanomassiliicoccales archaeon]|nr:deoxyribodipyrimidine photo-lyase [Methanomassiliicoccales archaeon]
MTARHTRDMTALPELIRGGDEDLPTADLEERTRTVKHGDYQGGQVVYWMNREQRLNDNHALLHAIATADHYSVPVCVAFCLTPQYLDSTLRHYRFMIKGLMELEGKMRALGIGFRLLQGLPEVEFPQFLHTVNAGILITDFSPLIPDRVWKRKVASEIDLPVIEVDSHNIVPCWRLATRRISTYATFNARVSPLLGKYLTNIPAVSRPKVDWTLDQEDIDWNAAEANLKIDRSVGEVSWIKPGEEEARKRLELFLREKLPHYREKSDDPNAEMQSDLSPYLHFGQISAQRVAWEVSKADASLEEKGAFFDQLIVRKELADNFCLHTPDYDTTGAYPIWARRSLDEHRSDEREHVYTLQQLESAQSYDPLWNAAQMEMVKIGKIRGSLRAYWAEKILEWTRSPEEALFITLYLNNKYELDGNDPNGYTGIAMVIGGLYGRPWRPKEVIGKVQKLTYTEERLSHDIKSYIERVKSL